MNSSRNTQLKTSPLSQLPSILITSGGTKEPIDRVRYISNISQGLTGSNIAKELLLSGFHVTFLYAKKSLLPSLSQKSPVLKNFKAIPFETFLDFKESLTNLLSKNSYPIIIHSAALSDFSIESIEQGEKFFNPGQDRKFPSQKGNLTLHLKKNEKLLLKLKEISNHHQEKKQNQDSYTAPLKTPPLIFGFKLTHGLKGAARLKIINEVLKTEKVDFVIHNDFHEIEKMKEKMKKKTNFLKKEKDLKLSVKERKNFFDKNFHIFRIYKKENPKHPLIFLSKKSLAKGLSKLILGLKKNQFQKIENTF